MTAPRKPYVRRRYWNEPEMGWWERAYFLEVTRGLMITGGVFLRNMAKWLTGRKGALTAYYPEETRADYARGNRGKHILTQRPDGRPQCVACNMCATVCPAQCIEIDAAFDPDDPAHPKYPARFELDYSRCIFCGLCVEACPEDAIRMVKETPDSRASIATACGWVATSCSTGSHKATSRSPIRPVPPRSRSTGVATHETRGTRALLLRGRRVARRPC